MSDTKIGYDPFDTRGRDEAGAIAEAEVRQVIDTEESDIGWLMSNKKGRRIIWRLMDQSGVFRSSYDDKAMRMAFNEGFRNYGLKLLDMVHACCPELYPTMMKENTDGKSGNRRASQ